MDWGPVAAALEALAVEWLQPLNVVLLIGIIMVARFLHKANQRSDFNLVDALRGPDGKASMKLIFYMVGAILGSWVVMDAAGTWVQQPTSFVYLFLGWLALMISPKLFAEFIQAKFGKKQDDKDPEREHRDP